MTIKIFSSEELSNEAYHAETEHVSGSQLHKLFSTSPASFRYGVDEDAEPQDKSRPLNFGSCAHTNLLEPEKFHAEYIRGTMKDDNLDGIFLTTQAACGKFLTERGIRGHSGKKYPDLIQMVRSATKPGEVVRVLAEIEDQEAADAKATGRTIIRGDDFESCLKMREVLYQNGDVRHIIGTGQPEVSCFAVIDGVPVKVRWDYVYDWSIMDYKTTISAHPEQFARQCFNAGYYLKMALQHDVFELAYGRKPSAVRLLAQEKKHPFIPVMYRMTEEQLTIGRLQYKSALQQYRACKERDIWPAYGGGAEMELQTPAFVKNQYKDFIK